MGPLNTQIQKYRFLAQLLEYPANGALADLAVCRNQRLSSPQGEDPISVFLDAIGQLSEGACEELYTSTFDLAPVCTPYVSVHLFGAENYQRGQLMARLAEACDRYQVDRGGELPDHLTVLMRLLAVLPDDERWELIRCCLLESVKTMAGELERAQNPYRFVLEAIWIVLEADMKGEQSHA